MHPSLVALLIVVVGVLAFRAVTRERRDYARFKRLRSTALRRGVFRRWLIESLVVLGGLSGVVLIGAFGYVAPALRETRAWGLLGGLSDATAGSVVIGAVVAALVVMVVPILLLRKSVEEIPAVGDIRAILPRNRGELPYGAGLALTAGVVEELLFRLALPALLFGVVGSGPLAFGLSALLFGALHLYQGPLGMLFATVLGLLFTLLYVLSGTILLPIVMHAIVDLRSLVLIPIALGGVWTRQDPPTLNT